MNFADIFTRMLNRVYIFLTAILRLSTKIQIEKGDILSDGTLWEAQTALYFRGFCRPYCAVL